MIKKLLLALLIPTVGLSQQSTIQEQSQHYKNFSFTKDSQWDSLSTIENGVSPQLNQSTQKTSACNLSKKVYGWHPYWVGNVYTNYDWSMLSDFCYFDYSVSPTTGNNTNTSFAWATSAAVTTALSNSVNVHFCATLFSSHSTFWASSTAQQTFITNAINLLQTRGGNGINIDFEAMGTSDKAPFTAFMTNLCNQVHAANANYKVTMALYAVDWSATFDITALNPLVDNFIIMGYDYYYSGSTTAGPEAPLYNFQTGYNQTLNKSVTYYLNKGASKNKLLVGLPWYGREWETAASTAPSAVTSGGFTSSRTYLYIRNNSTTYSAANKHWESNSFNPYWSYQSAGLWRQCWIDDNYSYGRKFDMVNQRGLGGIGIWALGYDDGYSDLWNLIKDKFSTCATVACTDSVFDGGGPARNYNDNESFIYTLAPTGASQLKLNFSYAVTEAGFDSLYVYDGPTTASPTLGVYTGTTNTTFTLTSSSPSVTLKFKSDGATNRSGFKLVYQCLQDAVIPTTQITTPTGWITQNFITTYADMDNAGGSGIDKGFYQPIYFNGNEWRANGLRGFFNDDFATATINPDWTSAIGTWSIVGGALVQSDETNANTNIYASVTQSLSNVYLYHFKAAITGTNTNKRAGIYIAADAPSQTQRGNSYMIWLRPDQNSIEFYKSVANNIGAPTYSTAYTFSVGTTYDYKIAYDRILGTIKLWINNVYVDSWTDTTPHATGTAISFRSGNSNFKIDDLRVFRSRAASTTILVGAANTNDLRKENISPNIYGGKINSITKDNANNLSAISNQYIDIDWTKPTPSSQIKEGTTTDIDTTYVGTQLSLNYTSAKDTNSGITTYYYAIGTASGAKNTVGWTANALALAVTKTGLSLSTNQKYYVMTKALNGAGLMSDSTVSDGVLYLLPTTINEFDAINNLTVYPNPTTDKATIEIITDKQNIINYTLVDVQGKMIEQKQITVTQGSTTLQIDAKKLQLSKGIYYATFKEGEKQLIKKIVIE